MRMSRLEIKPPHLTRSASARRYII